MLSLKVKEHFHLKGSFSNPSEYFLIPPYQEILQELKAAIMDCQLVVLAGVIGSGKTTLIRQLRDELERDNKVLVSKPAGVEAEKANIGALVTALYYDLSPQKEIRVPSQSEKREQGLKKLIKDKKKPVVLFVDEAHDLHHKTLKGLKRLMEMIHDSKGKLSIVLIGHPKLKNDLKLPTMEEIGLRTYAVAMDGFQEYREGYVRWLVEQCCDDSISIEDVIEPEAASLLAQKLTTPSQIRKRLAEAMEEAYQIGIRPITTDIVASVLSPSTDELASVMSRNGYAVKDLAERFNASVKEIKSLMQGKLDATRSTELQEQMREAGLPI